MGITCYRLHALKQMKTAVIPSLKVNCFDVYNVCLGSPHISQLNLVEPSENCLKTLNHLFQQCSTEQEKQVSELVNLRGFLFPHTSGVKFNSLFLTTVRYLHGGFLY